ncbi:hypothetical protein L195_g045620, partial [Trifolium pratense]
RPIGIGVQGLAESFILLGMTFDSPEFKLLVNWLQIPRKHILAIYGEFVLVNKHLVHDLTEMGLLCFVNWFWLPLLLFP